MEVLLKEEVDKVAALIKENYHILKEEYKDDQDRIIDKLIELYYDSFVDKTPRKHTKKALINVIDESIIMLKVDKSDRVNVEIGKYYINRSGGLVTVAKVIEILGGQVIVVIQYFDNNGKMSGMYIQAINYHTFSLLYKPLDDESLKFDLSNKKLIKYPKWKLIDINEKQKNE